ncbi:MAG: hypothetical protein J5680_03615 [Neisseriaceae bacterium]|nr:hypothetical protein [Neisseriaceae bacterium]
MLVRYFLKIPVLGTGIFLYRRVGIPAHRNGRKPFRQPETKKQPEIAFRLPYFINNHDLRIFFA